MLAPKTAHKAWAGPLKGLISAKSIRLIWKTKAPLCLLSLPVSPSTHTCIHVHEHTHTETEHIFHQHIHQCPADIWRMWCAIFLWRHCHRTAYFTSPPDAGLSVSGRVFPCKTKNRAARALLPDWLADSLGTRQQREHKGEMYTVQSKVEEWGKWAIPFYFFFLCSVFLLIYLWFNKMCFYHRPTKACMPLRKKKLQQVN